MRFVYRGQRAHGRTVDVLVDVMKGSIRGDAQLVANRREAKERNSGVGSVGVNV
jgi:hypothetical protein